MKRSTPVIVLIKSTHLCSALFVAFFQPSPATAQRAHTEQIVAGYRITSATDSLEVTSVAPSILRIDVRCDGSRDTQTPVLDPVFHTHPGSHVVLQRKSGSSSIQTSALTATLHFGTTVSLAVTNASGELLISQHDILGDARLQTVQLERTGDDPVYGVHGLDRNLTNPSSVRTGDSLVAAGAQGNGGAPMFFTRRLGFLIDSVGGNFAVNGTQIDFTHPSRRELEYFILVGDPLQIMRDIADLSGHPPMVPRWTLGFLNSQWGLDETELRTIVQRYHAEHLPLDGFIMDYDWKAWGEDNYGEWRWNSTSGPGNSSPDKFPNGANGQLARDMLASGVHLAGILKPRILLYKPGSTSDFLEAAAYAEQHLQLQRSTVLQHGPCALRGSAQLFQATRLVHQPELLSRGTTLRLCRMVRRHQDRSCQHAGAASTYAIHLESQ